METGTFTHVPYITGYTSAESLVMIRELFLDGSVFDQVNADNEVLVPFTWNITRGTAASREIASSIANFYWNGQTLVDDLREHWARVRRDLSYVLITDYSWILLYFLVPVGCHVQLGNRHHRKDALGASVGARLLLPVQFRWQFELDSKPAVDSS